MCRKMSFWQGLHARQYQVPTHFDSCCFYYFVRNSLVALMEALRAKGIAFSSSLERQVHGSHSVKLSVSKRTSRNYQKFPQTWTREALCIYIYVYMYICIHIYIYIYVYI